MHQPDLVLACTAPWHHGTPVPCVEALSTLLRGCSRTLCALAHVIVWRLGCFIATQVLDNCAIFLIALAPGSFARQAVSCAIRTARRKPRGIHCYRAHIFHTTDAIHRTQLHPVAHH